MASKKKRPSPRPQSGSRPPAKRPGQPTGKGAPAAKAGGAAGAAPKERGAAGAGAAPKERGAAGAGAAPKAAGPAKAVPKPPRERTGPTRSERLAAAEAARRRKAARTRALIAGGLVAVLALLTITIINSRRSNSRVISELEDSGACNYDTRTDDDAGAGRNHIPGEVAYTVDPPAGGNHNPSPAPAGIFTQQNKPSDPMIVHSLEHGYVTIWHRPNLDPADLDRLRELARKYDRDVLLVPRASLADPVAATAWHRRLLCERLDTAALERFVTAYRNKGPEKVEH